ncbi:MAG: histidine phosphatase family protein, partial [Myxococcales bacterium]
MRLILLRHGQTSSNVSGALDTGDPGASLTEFGHAQARATARALNGRSIDAIFVSNLLRTHETAAPLAADLGLTPATYDGFREIRAGDYEMATDSDSVHGYLGTIIGWIEGQYDGRMAGGETGHEFLDRYDAAIDQVVRSGATQAVVVSHGAAIRTWVASRGVGADAERWGEHAYTPLHNTGAIELELVNQTWEVVDW